VYRYAALFLIVCAGCRRSPSGQGGGPNEAVEPVASEWCQHHVTCGRVAPSKKFADLDACMRETRERVAKDLGECRPDQAKLSACLSAIQHKTCDAFRVTTPEACEKLCN
jgi:hypothetical protein